MNVGTKLLLRVALRGILAAMVLGGLAWHQVRQQPDMYRASCLLVLDTIPFERPAAPPVMAAPSIEPGSAAFVRTAPPHPISMPDYAAILLCDELMEQLRPVLQQLLQAHEQGASMPSRAQVRAALEARPRILLQTPYDLYYQHTLELTATTTHPEASAGLANAWMELGTGLLDRLRRERLERTVSVLHEQEQRLRHVGNSHGPAKRHGQERVGAVQAELREKERAAADLEKQLQKTPPRDDAQAIADLNAAKDRLLRLNEEIKALQDRREELEQHPDEAASREEGAELARLASVSAKLADAELALADAAPVFRVVSRAYPPDQPAGPSRHFPVAAAWFLGLILGPAHFLFMRAVRIYGPMLVEK